MDYNNLNDLQRDALKEICNIGTGNAATALSQLLNRKVDISVPAVNIISFNTIMDKFGYEELAFGVILRVLGDTPGSILLLFNKESVINVVEILTGCKEEEISELGYSVICEIGNIIAGSYMNAISIFTKLNNVPSVPAVCYDMLSAILSTSFIESGQYDEYVLDLETHFTQDDTKEICGNFFYIPSPGSLERILNTLGVN